MDGNTNIPLAFSAKIFAEGFAANKSSSATFASRVSERAVSFSPDIVEHPSINDANISKEVLINRLAFTDYPQMNLQKIDELVCRNNLARVAAKDNTKAWWRQPGNAERGDLELKVHNRRN